MKGRTSIADQNRKFLQFTFFGNSESLGPSVSLRSSTMEITTIMYYPENDNSTSEAAPSVSFASLSLSSLRDIRS